MQFLLRTGQRVLLVRRRGQAVEHPREHLPPVGGQVPVHPAQAVHDTSRTVQQNQVGPAAHALQNEPPLHLVPQLVHRLQPEIQKAFHGRLDDFQDTPAGQVLAQEHAEHGRRAGILPAQSGELGPGLVGTGREEQADISPVPPYGQHHFIPPGLIDLVDPPAHQGGAGAPPPRRRDR